MSYTELLSADSTTQRARLNKPNKSLKIPYSQDLLYTQHSWTDYSLPHSQCNGSLGRAE